MSPFAVLALFAQACLIQSVMSHQCGCGCESQISYGSYGSCAPAPIILPSHSLSSSNLNLGSSKLNLGSSNLNLGSIALANQGAALLNTVSAASCGSYGGVGSGAVGVAGDIGVAGNTVVVGSVPVLGAVDFSGIVPASGSVFISGQCGCGCN